MVLPQVAKEVQKRAFRSTYTARHWLEMCLGGLRLSVHLDICLLILIRAYLAGLRNEFQR